jgi:LysR family carnitine catabolism transcriptional activator
MADAPHPGNLTIRQLELFAVAARATTFSAAAATLGISQPSLSAAIGKMERQLGVALFDRSTRQLAVSGEGARFALAADDLIRIYRSSIRNLRAGATASRRVAFAVAPSLGSIAAAEAIAALKAVDGAVEVAVHDVGRRESIALLLDGVIDFAAMIDAPTLTQLERETIGSTHFVAVFAAGSLLAAQGTLGWRELVDHPLILAGDLRQRGLLQSMWEGDGADLHPAYEVAELTTGLGLAAQGLGYVLLPNVFVAREAMPHLAWGRLDCHQLVRPLEVVFVKGRPLSDAARALVEALREAVARLG